MNHRVVITGIGWITPMGHNIEDVWRGLLAGESGIARTTLFDASTFPTTISAEVKDFSLDSHVQDLDKHLGAGRNTQFALAACAQAWRDAKLDAAKLD
ncbi:MAG: beta-ketoacyl-[acyl-carrier-protein] synthase II, partial [Anaerolineae bacterium]|nr:beta-ketoacyl-[acyl-carrier-protein] synthase II [Phycisphaerae bacterium]